MTSSPRRQIPNTDVARSRAEVATTQKLKYGEDDLLEEVLEFLDGFSDGAPDAGRIGKQANYLAGQLRARLTKRTI